MVSRIDFRSALRRAHGANPTAVPDVLAAAAADLGATDLVVYLVDFIDMEIRPNRDEVVRVFR